MGTEKNAEGPIDTGTSMDTDVIGKHVVVLGINHTSSKAELRDRLLFPADKLESALEKLAKDKSILESYILSTCNRVEVYAVVEKPEMGRQTLLAFLSDFHRITVAEFAAHVYYYSCQKAIEHLFAVASSIDSMVVGEAQILGQVKDAYRIARQKGNTGTMLNKLIHFAIESGKRVRAETKIGDGILSVSSAAVDCAKKILGNLSARTALIIGAGEMSKSTARYLVAAGIKKMYFANRTQENAALLADKFNGIAVPLSDRDAIMPECDIVISSTGSTGFIITADQIKNVMTARKHRAFFLIDIAAPRDIHPDVGRLRNVFLYTIDDLSRVISHNSQMRAGEIDKVNAIMKEGIEDYVAWYRSLKVLPTLVSLRKRFQRICDDEIERYATEIGSLPGPAQQLIRQFASSLTQKLLDHPSKILKEVASDGESEVYTKSIETIFNCKRPHDG
jgi:glutamyl-tRNA reductase